MVGNFRIILGMLGWARLSFTKARDQKIHLLESFNPVNLTNDCDPPLSTCGYPIEKEPSNVSLKIVDGWPASTFDWPWSWAHHRASILYFRIQRFMLRSDEFEFIVVCSRS